MSAIDAKDVVKTLLVASPELVGLVLHGVELLRADGSADPLLIAKLDRAIEVAASRNRSAEAAAELDADIKAKGG